MAARFEVWRLDFTAAWKILGTTIGMCPKEVLLKGYIQLEMGVHLDDHCHLFRSDIS